MLFLPRDLLYIGLAALAGLVLLVSGYFGLRHVLSPKEWRVLGKCAGLLGLLFILLIRMIYVDLPVEKFIYGKF